MSGLPSALVAGLAYAFGLLALLVGFGCVGPRLQVAHGYVVARCNYAGIPERACLEDIAAECPQGFEIVAREQNGGLGMVTITARCAASSTTSEGES
jgi:hypothetical protein